MITIKEMSELEIPKYAPIFQCVYDLFGDYAGTYWKLEVHGQEKILQRLDDLCVLYTLEEEKTVSYEMFTIDENYKVSNAGFDDYEMHMFDDTLTIQERDSSVIQSLAFTKRNDGVDNDGYDGLVTHVQYNQEKDIRLMIMYQQMYNSMDRIYSMHVDKPPFQITIERGVVKKQAKGLSAKPISYIREEYDFRDNPDAYNMATIKDYGLVSFLKKGAYALQKDDVIARYYKILYCTKDRQAFTGFPFCKQYTLDDFSDFMKENGFRMTIPAYLLDLYNGVNVELNAYQEIADFIKEYEMTLPDEVIQLKLVFEEGDSDDTDSSV